MTVMTAEVMVLWRRTPGFRILALAVLALAEAALIITSGHWVGDTIAGIFLGAFVGWWFARGAGNVQLGGDPHSA